VLGWSPQQFWSASLSEFFAAFDGWSESNGVDTTPKESAQEFMARIKRENGAPRASIRNKS